MLRIDETSKTLVAPPAGGLVTEVNPDRDEMLALVSSSWEAFAGELGQPSLRFVAQGQAPGFEVLAFDEQAGRAVVVGVASEVADAQLSQALTGAASVAAMDAAALAAVHESLQAAVPGDSPQIVMLASAFDEQAGRAVVVGVASEVSDAQLTHALSAAAAVAGMDAATLASVHDSLQAAVPGDSPQLVLLASAFDANTLSTVDWLTRRHGLEISCFVLSVFRFGAERLLSIRREYPARDVNAPDPAAEVQRMLSGAAGNTEAELAANGHSTPPPAL